MEKLVVLFVQSPSYVYLRFTNIYRVSRTKVIALLDSKDKGTFCDFQASIEPTEIPFFHNHWCNAELVIHYASAILFLLII